jgi:hypothetical protein
MNDLFRKEYRTISNQVKDDIFVFKSKKDIQLGRK